MRFLAWRGFFCLRDFVFTQACRAGIARRRVAVGFELVVHHGIPLPVGRGGPIPNGLGRRVMPDLQKPFARKTLWWALPAVNNRRFRFGRPMGAGSVAAAEVAALADDAFADQPGERWWTPTEFWRRGAAFAGPGVTNRRNRRESRVIDIRLDRLEEFALIGARTPISSRDTSSTTTRRPAIPCAFDSDLRARGTTTHFK